jgi:C1A family cysteine protease
MSLKRKLNWLPSPLETNFTYKSVSFTSYEEASNNSVSSDIIKETKQEVPKREITRQGSIIPSPIIVDVPQPVAKKLLSSGSLPLKVDLSGNCSPVKDQGEQGSCVAFATIGAMEYIQKKNLQRFVSLSERFTYYVTRVKIENAIIPPSDTGSYIVDALKSVVDYGTCLNNSFPYTSNYTVSPPTSAYTEALKYEVLTYAKFPDYTNTPLLKLSFAINTLKASLNAGYPIIAGFTCYSNLFSTKYAAGVIPLPGKNSTIIGGHAILITGYDDATEMFKFKNSWGIGFGINGYGQISYKYYLQGMMSDLWSIYSEEVEDVQIGSNVSISNPLINSEIVKNQLQDVFSDVMSNLTEASDPKTSFLFFKSLQSKYSDNKLSVFLKAMEPLVVQFMKS